MENKIYFAKGNDSVIIPSKRDEDMGYDIYANFEEPYMILKPYSVTMIPTNLYSACSDGYGFLLKERGSTGIKGMAVRCGVIDSGYRDAWFVPISNITNKPILLIKDNETKNIKIKKEINQSSCNCDQKEAIYYNDEKVYDFYADTSDEVVIYPYSKAICQALVVPVPKTSVSEIPLEELKTFKSERGEGKIGSSNK